MFVVLKRFVVSSSCACFSPMNVTWIDVAMPVSHVGGGVSKSDHDTGVCDALASKSVIQTLDPI